MVAEGFLTQDVKPEGEAASVSRPPVLRLSLFAAAALMLIGAGILLWWREGASIFGEHLLAAIAWCF